MYMYYNFVISFNQGLTAILPYVLCVLSLAKTRQTTILLSWCNFIITNEKTNKCNRKQQSREVHKERTVTVATTFPIFFLYTFISTLSLLEHTTIHSKCGQDQSHNTRTCTCRLTPYLCLCSDESLPVGNHLNEELHCTLQHQGTVVGDIPKDKQGIDTCDIVSPARKVSDDGLKCYHGDSN